MSETQEQAGVPFEWIKTELQAVTVRRGDTLVLFYPGALSPRASAHLIATVQEVFPGHEVLVLDEGIRLGIVHAEDAEDTDEGSDLDDEEIDDL